MLCQTALSQNIGMTVCADGQMLSYMQLKDAALELDGKPAIYALSKTKT